MKYIYIYIYICIYIYLYICIKQYVLHFIFDIVYVYIYIYSSYIFFIYIPYIYIYIPHIYIYIYIYIIYQVLYIPPFNAHLYYDLYTKTFTNILRLEELRGHVGFGRGASGCFKRCSEKVLVKVFVEVFRMRSTPSEHTCA